MPALLTTLQSLTVMWGDGVGHVYVSISRPGPHAAVADARITVSLILMVIGDVIYDEGLILPTHCWKKISKSQFNMAGKKSLIL